LGISTELNGVDVEYIELDSSEIYSHTILYYSVDQEGNRGEATRIVNVTDSSATETGTTTPPEGDTGTTTPEIEPEPDVESPIITVLGENPLQIEVSENFVDPGATALDNVDGDISDLVIVEE